MTTTTTTKTETTTEKPNLTPALSVTDTETDNRRVMIPSATIDEDGWGDGPPSI